MDRIGPYHAARLSALTRTFAVSIIECFGQSEEYAWDPVADTGLCDRYTLFPDCSRSRVSSFKLVKEVERSLSDLQPSVVAIPGWSDKAALAALRWCLKSKVPSILCSESTEQDAKRMRWKESIKRFIVAGFSAALVGGERHAHYLRELNFPERKTFTGYDAVDNEYFWKRCDDRRRSAVSTRKKLSLPEAFFLASARFVEKKNLRRLISAYAGYVNTACVKPWGLVILGDGPLKPVLKDDAEVLGVSNLISFPGFKQYDEIPSYYALASAFVHASTTEPWGLVVNEAMASGLPVLVSSRCGCAPDLVDWGVNGFTFDPFNPAELTELFVLLSNRSDLPEMGIKSREIISRFGLERFSVGMRLAFEAALAISPPRLDWAGRSVLSAMLYR